VTEPTEHNLEIPIRLTQDMAESPELRDLNLGWRLTESLEPRFSLTGHEFIRVKGEWLDHHIAIVGQSGYGKSTLLARLVEELLIRTQARCIVFDPNADFRRINELESTDKLKERLDELPCRIPGDGCFAECWNLIDKKVYFGRLAPPPQSNQLTLPWPVLSLDAIAVDDDTPTDRDELDNCHQFIRDICFLMAFEYRGRDQTPKTSIYWDMIEWPKAEIEDARKEAKLAVNGSDYSKNDEKEMFGRLIERKIRDRFGDVARCDFELTTPFLHRIPSDSPDDLIKSAIDCAKKFNEDIQHRYFLRADRYKRYGFIETGIDNLISNSDADPKADVQTRVQVVDLPSFQEEARLAAVGGVLELIWRNAQLEWANATTSGEGISAPTFIVIDEAHNLIPEGSDDFYSNKVRDLFRRFAAEGRKYGLFLIIGTQRPDKIDRFVVSECGNLAIMKLGSPSVLNVVKNSFGLEGTSESALANSLNFKHGHVFLTGKWAQPHTSQMLRCGLRRSKEGTERMKERWVNPDPEIRRVLERIPEDGIACAKP
jgi:GTPase SAR1 family protein